MFEKLWEKSSYYEELLFPSRGHDVNSSFALSLINRCFIYVTLVTSLKSRNGTSGAGVGQFVLYSSNANTSYFLDGMEFVSSS